MSNTNKLFVVGDKMNKFAQLENVIPLSQLEEMIQEAEGKKSTDDQFLVYIGQGINWERLTKICSKIVSKGLEAIYQIIMPANFEKADSVLTHKHKSENSMISIPVKMESGNYLSTLMLDDGCAEMSDHVTGQHIQGMVLIEAARQMTLAVTEKYFLQEHQRGKMYFVTNALETKFINFIFPIDVQLHYEILKSRGIGSNQNFEVNIKFIQNGKVGTEVKYGFTVMDPSYMVKKEEEQARMNLQLCMA